jgi:glutathione S-transferase
LLANGNVEPWFLGINPRGLAPVLVHNGAVHIESNDIIQYMEKVFPEPRLIPVGHEKEVAALLKQDAWSAVSFIGAGQWRNAPPLAPRVATWGQLLAQVVMEMRNYFR